MVSVSQLSDAEREDIVQRLKRIEGQARGVQKMVEEGRDCMDVLNQISAIRAAANGLSGELLETYLVRCMVYPDEFEAPQKAVRQAVRTLIRNS